MLIEQKTYFVYILTTPGRTTYIGFTRNLMRRMSEHKSRSHTGFVARYGLDQLIYYEEFADVKEAIACEKQLKSWRRSKKVALVNTLNPDWCDLAEDWVD